METYNPEPIDLTEVELPEELKELREAIAENAHEVWAANRKADGWNYGARRDDLKKEHPCMVEPFARKRERIRQTDGRTNHQTCHQTRI